MAPEVSIIKHSNAFQNNSHSFTKPTVETSTKKRRSKELNPNAPVFKRRKVTGTVFAADPEVITIDSDSDVEKTRSPTRQPIDDNSDNESVKIYEPEHETIEVNDSDDGDLIININQTENVDRIVESALGKRTNERSNDIFMNGLSATKKRIHWTDATGYPKSWTKEMLRFYTEPCEKNRVFDYQKILSKLKSKPSDWWINREDMIGPGKKRRSFEMCRKCGKYGHLARECTKADVCYVCGQLDHVFPNCPNTRCLTCGNPASTNTMRCYSCDRAFRRKVPCGLCNQNSHEEFMCPSKWRKHTLLDSPSETLRLNSKRCCYNCASTGHFGFECPSTPDSPYPVENPLLTASIDRTGDQNNNNNVIFVSNETAELLGSAATGNTFFERLSKEMNCRIELCRGVQNYVRIVGEEDNVRVFKEELEKLRNDSR